MNFYNQVHEILEPDKSALSINSTLTQLSDLGQVTFKVIANTR